ncbi:MAG: hypothetical protein NT130_01045 [Candidatus Micrarchaeota archaeon]|nr:hypothetical protein [Candidatus Micrarchaeota archaeon]
MPSLKKAQAMIIDGVLSLFLAIILSYSLFAAWPQDRHETGDLALERAGYDIVNAFYEDEMLYSTIARGLEFKGYLSGGEINSLSLRLYNYGKLLGVSRIDVDIEGSSSFSVQISSAPLTRREQFPVIIPLKGGADSRLIRVSLWR